MIVLLCVITGCGQQPEQSPTEMVVQMSSYLLPDEVRTAVGFSVGEPLEIADGSVAYTSVDGGSIVYVSSKEMSRESFDSMMTEIAGNGSQYIDAPNLGEKAYWIEDEVNLLVYAKGVGVDVRVEYATHRPNDSLLAARQLAALYLEKIA
jgi:hypothetical protein